MGQKIDVRRIFTAVFETYKSQAGLLLPAALIVFLPVAIINAIIGGVGTGLVIVLTVLAGAISLIGTFWYQGMVVEAVRDMQDGVRDFSIGSLFRSVTPVLGMLIGAGVLAGLGIALGFLLLVVPGLLLLTWWAVIAPVVVIERPGVTPAFGRSRALVRGNGWQVFGVLALLFLLQLIVSTVIGALIGGVASSAIGSAIATLIAQTLVAPLSGLAAANLYFALRHVHGEAPVPGGLAAGGRGAAAPGPAPEASGVGGADPERRPPDAPGSPGSSAPPPA